MLHVWLNWNFRMSPLNLRPSPPCILSVVRHRKLQIYYASASASLEFRAKGRQSDIRTIWNFRNFHLKFIQTKVVGALHTHRTCVQLRLTRWCKRCARLLCMPNNLAERLKFFFLSQVFIIQASLHFRFRLSSVQLMYEFILYLNCAIESIRFTKYHHSTYSQQPN